MKTISPIVRKIDETLYARGFITPEARTLVRNQLVLTVLLGVIALIVSGGRQWAADFLAGAVIAGFNFAALAKMVQGLVRMGKTRAVTAQLFVFYSRMFLTCLALYALIVLAGSSIWALVAGLSTVVVNILVWGATRLGSGQKVKEAMSK